MTKFNQLLSNIKTDRVYIQTHNFPDPDAISSAFGLSYLLKKSGIESVICYKGKIDRKNTRKMLKIFGIEAVNVDDMPPMTEDSYIILVDAQQGNGNTYKLKGGNIISIDHHHVPEKNVSYCFSDIREDVGACASIIASYFFENNIDIPTNVATALLYGIKIDTAQMSRGVSKLDMDAFYKLFFKSDNSQIADLTSNNMQLCDLKAYSSAIDSISVDGMLSFADTGDNCPEALIAEIADFMVALDDVYFSVVYSIKENGIKFSVRSEAHSGCHAGKIIIEVLDGFGTGGGHSTMAGGYVPLENAKEKADEVLKVIKERFKQIVKYNYEKNKK